MASDLDRSEVPDLELDRSEVPDLELDRSEEQELDLSVMLKPDLISEVIVPSVALVLSELAHLLVDLPPPELVSVISSSLRLSLLLPRSPRSQGQPIPAKPKPIPASKCSPRLTTRFGSSKLHRRPLKPLPVPPLVPEPRRRPSSRRRPKRVNKPEANAKSAADAAVDTYASAKPKVYFIKYQGNNAKDGASAGASGFSGGSAFGASDASAYSNAGATAYSGAGASGFGGSSGFGGAGASGGYIGVGAVMQGRQDRQPERIRKNF